MYRMRSRRLAASSVAALLVVLTTATAQADPPPGPVDESRLVPALSPSFAPWTCKAMQTGPVCDGERNVATEWGPFDFSCGDFAVYARTDSVRRQTRYYNWDYLDYENRFWIDDIDYLSTSLGGPATARITATMRAFLPVAVPGDGSTITVVTEGVPWDIRSAQGPSLWRAAGTLVEPPGEVGTFTGHVTDHGVTTAYENAPLTQVLPDEKFVNLVCEAVTGGR